MSVTILRGDCRDLLASMPDESVNCCITSPPYWQLRSYLPADHPDKHREIGSEPTVEEWVETMVQVFRQVRRVLRNDGTLWLNLGDSYAGSRCGGHSESTGLRNPGQKIDNSAEAKAIQRTTASRRRDDHEIPRSDLRMPGYKPKDLIGQPWMLAFALRADGWYLRQEIIWAKRSPMPESARDRFTKAHEQVFLLSKRPTYYFDFEAIQEPASDGTHSRRTANGELVPAGWATGEGDHTAAGHQTAATHRKVGTGVGFGHGTDAQARERGRVKPPGNKTHSAAALYEAGDEHHRTKGGLVKYAERQRERAAAGERMGRGAGWRERKLAEAGDGTKNNDSFDDAMAVMPATRNPRSVRWLSSEPFRGAHFATYPPALIEPFVLAGCPPGGTVLDPFGGSGTTGLVADRLGRNAVLIDLDERNIPMAEQRIEADKWNAAKRTPGLFEEAAA